MTCLRDSFNRPINYLRISVTDRCNFRCVYCMPAEGVRPCSHGDILSYEEMAVVARAAASLGISKLRITGGEPLVRLGVVDFVKMLASIPGVDDLALSTNGALLEKFAVPLKEAGLRRVNISLDSMKPARFQEFTRCDKLAEVMGGIAAAEQAGLKPIKINTVAMRGSNDDELVEMAARTLDNEWHIRFIELMPIGRTTDWKAQYISAHEMRERIAVLGPLEPVCPDGSVAAPGYAGDGGENGSSAGPARYYRLPGAKGTIGFISAISEHFCQHCNRLRLTADGRLRPCLMWDKEVDLRTALRQGATEDEIREIIRQATLEKPWGHLISQGMCAEGRTMSEIGG